MHLVYIYIYIYIYIFEEIIFMNCFSRHDPQLLPSSTFKVKRVWCLFAISTIQRIRSRFRHIGAMVLTPQDD